MKEKLIEILKQAEEATPCALDPGVDCKGKRCVDCVREASADRLIASGVVVSKMETTTRWIPVTERLPEKSGSYLVCSDREAVYETRFYPKKHFQNGYIREAGFTKRGKTIITHWMPLPEPPKGE